MTVDRQPVGIYGLTDFQWWLPVGEGFTLYRERKGGDDAVMPFAPSEARDLYELLRQRFEKAESS